MSDRITEVTGTITTSDGHTRQFSITAGLGWQQWGNATEKLGNTVYAVEAMETALLDFLAEEA